MVQNCSVGMKYLKRKERSTEEEKGNKLTKELVARYSLQRGFVQEASQIKEGGLGLPELGSICYGSNRRPWLRKH